ncbi:MAG: amidohydrolase family protein [Dorea sp.]|nr:amidohydrolase family protein [Dorea sp.]
MVIDFHTHIFPDKIAEKTLDFLSNVCHSSPYTNGTYEGLKKSAQEAGIAISVALPAVTKVSQMDSVNRFAAQYQEAPVISFGGIHPDCSDVKHELKNLKAMGMKGIKLHPDYQDCYFNDLRYKRLISDASELGLIIVVHAGVDPKCPEDIHCTPEMAREVIREVKPEKLVLAHMGGNALWDDVERYLVGEEVYFDTGVVLDRMPEEQFLRIVRMHGADKILFATDSPWAGQKQFVEVFSKMPLSEEEKERILYKNACQLLKLENMVTCKS